MLYLSHKNGGDDQGSEEKQVVWVCRQLLVLIELLMLTITSALVNNRDTDAGLEFLQEL